MRFGVGVLGATGYIGTPYRRDLRELPEEAKIVALCARRRELLDRAAAEDGAAVVSTAWRDVVEHPDVNLVIVATPDSLHCEQALAAAEAGKHLVCEKPLGRSAEEAAAIWDAYRGTSLGHFVPFWTRYFPVFDRARQIVQQGTLGEVKSVVYRWHNPRPAAMPFTWRDDAAVSAAGSIADVGSHAYETIRWILQCEATRVLAHAKIVATAKPHLGEVNLSEALDWGAAPQAQGDGSVRVGTAPDYATIAFEMEGGIVGTLMVSHASYIRKGLAPELEFHGTEASLAVDRLNSRVTVATADGTKAEQAQVPDSGTVNRFARYVLPALRSRAAGEPTEHPGLEEGWRVQCFTDAAALAAEQGQWVAVQPDRD